MLFNEADQYCSPKNVTKAMLHIKNKMHCQAACAWQYQSPQKRSFTHPQCHCMSWRSSWNELASAQTKSTKDPQKATFEFDLANIYFLFH